jgi:riboflavin kinase/FMN adenylyltransferase
VIKYKNKFIRGLHNLKPAQTGCVATIGSFDGIHLGHRAILKQLIGKAKDLKLPSVVMIFEPQPQEFFSGEQAPARLMRLREKVEEFIKVGIDKVFCLQFNRSLRGLSATDFVEQVLVSGLKIQYLVVGDDFRFGHDRSGNFQLLQNFGKNNNFEVIDTCTMEYKGERISSTRIRSALKASKFNFAERLLGAPYRITGCVIYGQGLGREIGVPTANVQLQRFSAPLNGVFIVQVYIDERCLQGVANVGIRPTIGDLIEPILEVHLIDFNEDIYGRRIHVEFKSKIRDEKIFPSLNLMVKEIHRDIHHAKQYFSVQPKKILKND